MAKRITSISKFFLIILIVFSLVACTNSNQNHLSLESYINIDRAMETIEKLTLPKYDGRLPGTQGNTLAVNYIAENYKSMELESHNSLIDYRQSYQQKVIITETTPELNIINQSCDVIKGFQFPFDFKVMTFWPGLRIEGDMQGKIAVITDESALNDLLKYKDKIVLIDQSVIKGRHPEGPYEILERILKSDHKVKGIIFNLDDRYNDSYQVKPNIYNVVTGNRQPHFNNEGGPFVVYCTQDVFDDLAKASYGNLELTISAHYTYKDEMVSNVIGIIPGVHEELKNNTIIIGAHLDHVGENKEGTYQPGALDNASGIAAMMEIASTIKDAGIPPNKTIVFIAFNGEEMGLFGSTHYVRNPLFPLTKTIVINLDMVGSKKVVPLTISSDLDLLKNKVYDFALNKGIDCIREKGLPSDQIPFTLRGVNGITLIHNDQTHVHTYKDNLENIDKDRLAEIIRLVVGFIEKTAY